MTTADKSFHQWGLCRAATCIEIPLSPEGISSSISHAVKSERLPSDAAHSYSHFLYEPLIVPSLFWHSDPEKLVAECHTSNWYKRHISGWDNSHIRELICLAEGENMRGGVTNVSFVCISFVSWRWFAARQKSTTFGLHQLTPNCTLPSRFWNWRA